MNLLEVLSAVLKPMIDAGTIKYFRTLFTSWSETARLYERLWMTNKRCSRSHICRACLCTVCVYFHCVGEKAAAAQAQDPHMVTVTWLHVVLYLSVGQTCRRLCFASGPHASCIARFSSPSPDDSILIKFRRREMSNQTCIQWISKLSLLWNFSIRNPRGLCPCRY